MLKYYKILEFSVYGIWILSELLIKYFKRGGEKGNRGIYTNALISIMSIPIATLGILIGVLANFKNIRWLYSPDYILSCIGLFLVLAGVAIRWSAVLTLKKFFTVDVSIREDQKLIQTGLFKVVRHPSYLGFLVSVLGLGGSFVNWLSILVLVIPQFILLYQRIKEEEKVLTTHFGQAYEDYRRRTKALIPFIY
jgi:protein-S-isoprenylcysteine O-methyltransferase Ste14